MARDFGGFSFQRLGVIAPERSGREFIVDSFDAGGARLNTHGSGPFCRFNLKLPTGLAGVYLITVDGTPVYVGEALDLNRRFGLAGYGRIVRRKTLHDGQATNCKVNNRVLAAAQAGSTIELWFHQSSDRERVEADLISRIQPPWNGARPSGRPRRRAVEAPVQQRLQAAPKSAAFARALEGRFLDARRKGLNRIQVNAGDLHREVGGYPVPNNRMPSCCHAMVRAIRPGDVVVTSPPKGLGASLTIEYKIPR